MLFSGSVLGTQQKAPQAERSAVRFGAPHELPCGGHPNCHSRLVSGMFGGSAGYARGFLPLFVLLVVALPVVGVLNQLGTRHGLGLA